jgi:hypothetical protein
MVNHLDFYDGIIIYNAHSNFKVCNGVIGIRGVSEISGVPVVLG